MDKEKTLRWLKNTFRNTFFGQKLVLKIIKSNSKEFSYLSMSENFFLDQLHPKKSSSKKKNFLAWSNFTDKFLFWMHGFN